MKLRRIACLLSACVCVATGTVATACGEKTEKTKDEILNGAIYMAEYGKAADGSPLLPQRIQLPADSGIVSSDGKVAISAYYYRIDYIDITETETAFKEYNDYIYMGIVRFANMYLQSNEWWYDNGGTCCVVYEEEAGQIVERECPLNVDLKSNYGFDGVWQDFWQHKYVKYEQEGLLAPDHTSDTVYLRYQKSTGEYTVYDESDAPLGFTFSQLWIGCRDSELCDNVHEEIYSLSSYTYNHETNEYSWTYLPKKPSRIYGGTFFERSSVLMKIEETDERIAVDTRLNETSSILRVGSNCLSDVDTLKGLTLKLSNNLLVHSGAIVACDNLEWLLIDNPDGNYLQLLPQAVQNCGKLNKIFYKGTQADYEKYVRLYPQNDVLRGATAYFYAETAQAGGNYWHYDTDGVTPIVWA